MLSHSFAKHYDVLVIMFSFLHFTLNAHRFWWHKVIRNRYTMSNITPPIWMPKDVNDRLRRASGLDPDNPNDMAFKLVTILYFFVSQKLTFFSKKHKMQPLPSPPHWSLNQCHPPPLRPPLGLSVQGTGNGVFRVLWGWQWWGERAVVGVPWRFGAAALQHHRRQEGKAVAVVGVPRHFQGRNVRPMVG